MGTVEVPDLMPYLRGLPLDRNAIEKALKDVPCPDGYHFVVLENCDVMLAPDRATPG